VLAERRRRPDQRIGPLGFQFGREPWPLQDPYHRPSGRGQVVLGGAPQTPAVALKSARSGIASPPFGATAAGIGSAT